MRVYGKYLIYLADDSAKIPAVLHGAMTNLLIFHPFLLLNGNYRAVKKLGPILKPTPEDDPAIGDAAGSDFSPLTEPEVMTGHIVKERLLLLLAHPGLQNHLLRYQNLLDLVVSRGSIWLTAGMERSNRSSPPSCISTTRRYSSHVRRGGADRGGI